MTANRQRGVPNSPKGSAQTLYQDAETKWLLHSVSTCFIETEILAEVLFLLLVIIWS